MLHRLPFFSLQSQKLGETLMRSGKVSLDPQCIIERLRCLVIPALGGVNTSQAIVSLGRFGRQPCGFLQLGNSLFDPPLPSERDSQIQVRPTQGRIQFNRLTKLPDAAFEVTLLGQQLTEVAVRFGSSWDKDGWFLRNEVGPNRIYRAPRRESRD